MILMFGLLVSQVINILGDWSLHNLVVLGQYDFIANRLSSLRAERRQRNHNKNDGEKLQTGWVRLGLDMRGLS